jgi:hypothetical protein
VPIAKEQDVKARFAVLMAFVVLGLQLAAAQTHWLTDDQAREVAARAIRPVHPHPCYSTYRNEHLESFVLGLRKEKLVGNRLNNSVYVYRVAVDVCDYVVEEDGKPAFTSVASVDCCDYGMVAVDRATAKSYWFPGEKTAADTFKGFVHDEQLLPDLSRPVLFTALYLDLVWGSYDGNEITSLGQLRDVAERNFRSAYSPYERDNAWAPRFHSWWRRLRSQTAHLKLETTYEPTSEGTIVRGYAFSGFLLTTPRSGPPPKGTPRLLRWTLLIKPDGTVEERPSKAIYPRR